MTGFSHGATNSDASWTEVLRVTRAKVVNVDRFSLCAAKIVSSILRVLSQEVPSIIMIKS
jgi:hypothetical protein